MANVEHSTLTTTNLHENKGVSTATDNTVATAVSSATVWAKLTASNLTGTGNAFGAQLLHVRDQVGSGVASQTLTSSTWNTRRLQTSVTNEIASATLVSNVISLPAGTYYIEAKAIWRNGSFGEKAQLRLRNTTDATTTLLGQSHNFTWSGSGITVSVNMQQSLQGRFTLAGTKNLELQNWTLGTSPTGGGAVSSGENEVYADVLIWKVL